MVRKLALVTAALMLLFAGNVGSSQEAVDSFFAEITVLADGSVLVTEHIEITSTGNEFRRGIYRDYTTRWQEGLFMKSADFTVVDVFRDGRFEPWRAETFDNTTRIYIGAEDVFLAPGKYMYSLTYKLSAQVGQNSSYDELYWNLTGDEWNLPINAASAALTLPPGAEPEDYFAYTGRYRMRGTDYHAWVDTQGVFFETARALQPGEGITLVVQWPKGYVVPGPRGLSNFLRDNIAFVVGLAGLVLSLAYYILAWGAIGRDPRRDTIFPRFQPPKGISPAAARFILKMGFDDTAFAALVLGLAVRGALTIQERGTKYLLHFLDQEEDLKLTPEEEIALITLRSGKKELLLDRVNQFHLSRARENCLQSLLRYKGQYFHTNQRWLVPGIVIGMFVLLGAAFLASLHVGFLAVFMTIWLGLWSAGTGLLLMQVAQRWRAVRKKSSGGTVASALFHSFFSLPFVSGWVFGAWVLASVMGLAHLLVLTVLIVVNGIFAFLLKAPTSEGRRIMDEIEGFRMYLATAETRSLEAPQVTPEIFDRFLPYAVALGVARQWGDKFAQSLSPEAKGYSSTWYRGASYSSFGVNGLAANMTGSFASTLSTVSRTLGSGSGGSGGSSGGGGGSRGGGGW